jgi:hypothetical protein
MREVLVSFLALVEGLLVALQNKFLSPAYVYRITAYTSDGNPPMVWETRTSEPDVVLLKVELTQEYPIERFTVARWVGDKWVDVTTTEGV